MARARDGGPAYPTSKSQRGGLTVRQRCIDSITGCAYGDHVREGVGQRARPAGAVGARR